MSTPNTSLKANSAVLEEIPEKSGVQRLFTQMLSPVDRLPAAIGRLLGAEMVPWKHKEKTVTL